MMRTPCRCRTAPWTIWFLAFAALSIATRAAAEIADDPGQAQRVNKFYARGAHDLASAELETALTRLEQTNRGVDDHTLVPLLRSLAIVRMAQRRPDAARDLMSRALPLAEQWILRGRVQYTSAGMARLLAYLRTDEDLVYSMLADRPSDTKLRRLAMTMALVRKGRGLEELRRTQRVFRETPAGPDAERLERLATLRARYATLALAVGSPAADSERARLAAEMEQLERTLLAGSAFNQQADGMLAMDTNVDLVLESVALGVGLGHVYVEIVNFKRYRFGGPGRAGVWQGREYLAMVMRSDAEIAVVWLGPEAAIDRTVRVLLREISRPRGNYREAAEEAYRKLLAPYRKHFAYPDIQFTHQRVVLSLDSELNLVPFDVLHDGKKLLAEEYRFIYVMSGRDASLSRWRARIPSRSVLVFADADFSASIPRSTDGRSLLPQQWAQLPGTALEAQVIHRLVPQAIVVTGRDASREHLFTAPPAGVLHIATHGFFIDRVNRGATGDILTTPQGGTEVVAELSRSGLLLTGSGTGGGIITALELSGANFYGTQLVVLSACETARGDVHVGEGVYGLRRAFLLAGAETVVMSLWRVHDAATSEVMSGYYHYLLAGEGRVEALRRAAADVRFRRPHPYYWAPFIVVGTEGPIAAFAETHDATPTSESTQRRRVPREP